MCYVGGYHGYEKSNLLYNNYKENTMVDSDECNCNKISIVGDKKCH